LNAASVSFEPGATAAPTRVGWSEQGLGPVVRGGIALCALGCLVGLFSVGSGLAEGRERFGFDEVTLDVPPGIIALGVVGFIPLVAAAALPFGWAHITGIGLGAAWASFWGFALLGGRMSNTFAENTTPTVQGGGAVLLIASLVCLAGVVVALVGLRASPRPDPSVFADSAGRTSGKSVAALVLGIGSILWFGAVLGALAITFATLGWLDIRDSDDRLRGKGLAIAGLVCGIVGFLLWTAGGLALAIFAENGASS